MTVTQILVGLGEIQVIQGVGSFMCMGLGSCVGVCITDSTAKVSGVAHVMLPKAFDSGSDTRPAKFADTGVITLVEMIERLGGDRVSMKAALIGGAQVIHGKTNQTFVDFGTRNISAIEETLASLNIPICGTDTGGTSGRTMTFDVPVGTILVRTPTSGDRTVCQLKEVQS